MQQSSDIPVTCGFRTKRLLQVWSSDRIISSMKSRFYSGRVGCEWKFITQMVYLAFSILRMKKNGLSNPKPKIITEWLRRSSSVCPPLHGVPQSRFHSTSTKTVLKYLRTK